MHTPSNTASSMALPSVPARLARAWRHWRSSAAAGRRAFPQGALDRIAEAIATGERSHRGEVRLIVEHALPFEAIWAGVSNRQRAVALFADYGVWDTEDNCGVLLYVNLAERKVEIVVDRGIARRIGNTSWQALCATMTDGFARGDFAGAVLAVIAQVHALLAQHFPATGARDNELPDQPLML